MLQDALTLNFGDYLRGVFGATAGTELLIDILGVVVVSTFCLLIVIYLIWLERKVIARMQDRIGPNRVGPFGLLQTIADVIKLLVKEPFAPAGADRLAYELAPFLTVMTALLMWAIVPFAPSLIGADLNIGIFYFLAVSSASVVVVLLAGWGSNNKYALLGAFRSVAQLVSYEVPMVMALLVPILLARSMSTQDIINAQTVPYLFVVPLSALIFFISALAETGRTPFDLLEAESEIVAGFHIEYSGMKFGMFFLAEFVGTLFMSALFAIVYLGGWNIPLINLALSLFGVQPLDLTTMVLGNWIGLVVFFVKMFLVYFVFIWIRATLPRVRVDQILNFNWKFLVPLSLVMILVVAVSDKLIPTGTPGVRPLVHLALNLLIVFATVEILRRQGRSARLAAAIGGDDDTMDDDHGHAHDHGHHHADDAHAAHPEPVAAH